MTVERPRDVMQWFESVPRLLTEQEWEVRERAGLSGLYHCHCPWGGPFLCLCTKVRPVDVNSPPLA